jgi:hypothetical protein
LDAERPLETLCLTPTKGLYREAAENSSGFARCVKRAKTHVEYRKIAGQKTGFWPRSER